MTNRLETCYTLRNENIYCMNFCKLQFTTVLNLSNEVESCIIFFFMFFHRQNKYFSLN